MLQVQQSCDLKWGIKGTVSIILSNLPFIEWHVRFTQIPFKSLFDQVNILLFIWREIKCQEMRKCTLARIVQCTL